MLHISADNRLSEAVSLLQNEAKFPREEIIRHKEARWIPVSLLAGGKRVRRKAKLGR